MGCFVALALLLIALFFGIWTAIGVAVLGYIILALLS